MSFAPSRESPLRVVIINDSATMRASLRAALSLAPDIQVVAEGADGASASALVARVKPSVVVMDVVMPVLDGYAATRAIMASVPTPIVMVSAAVDVRDRDVVLNALGAGALAITEAPPPPTDPTYRSRAGTLAQLLRLMAASRLPKHPATTAQPPLPPPVATLRRTGDIRAIGIAASTGGPGALVELLNGLPRGAMPPVLVVQHIARGFAPGFASWLAGLTKHRVVVPQDGASLEPGGVYVAPDDFHLGVSMDLRASLSDAPPIGPFRPSATHLFRSLATTAGARALGVVLTGMGDDGADGAAAMRRAGAQVVAQDEATSVIYGMPKAARERGGADVVLPLWEIPGWLCAKAGEAE